MIVKKPPRKPRIPKEKAKKRSAKSLLAEADRLAGQYCRSVGRCEAEGLSPKKCGGILQWCHVKSRGNKSIRHDPLNYVCMCTSCHQYFTMHPDKWVEAVETLRPGTWDRLNALLQEGLKPDYEYWIDFYKRKQC